MSASDAAPLPRLGEVFFDVRGHSRSMRLSWYADTDVAVFSIWQGGKCTGTFRLPMGDLSRMIEILQRGPDRRHPRGASGHGSGGHGAGARGAGVLGPGEGDRERRGPGYAESGHDADYSGEYDADHTVVHNAGGQSAGSHPAVGGADYGVGTYDPGAAGGPGRYDAGEYGPGEYDPSQYGGHQYGSADFSSGEFRSGGHGPGEYGSGRYSSGDYDAGDYGSADHRPGDYDDAGHGDAGYRDGGSRTGGHRSARHRTDRYEPPDYGRPDFEQAPGAPRPAYWQDDDHYQADVSDQRFRPADEAGYGQQRFVPPYVRPRPDSSESDFLDDAEYRLPADPADRPRHSAGRHSGGQAQ